MAKSISITTIGLNKVLKSLQSFPNDLKREVNAEFAAASDEVRREAVKNAPADESGLRTSIYKAKNGEFFEVGVGKAYAPFVEFGTKKRFKATNGFEGYARQFKGRKISSAGSLDEAILGWVKRKKIRFEKAGQQSIVGGKRRLAPKKLATRFLTDEQTAFIIARYIAFNGVRPHPFLFPAFVKVRRELTPKLTQAIRRAFK